MTVDTDMFMADFLVKTAADPYQEDSKGRQ